MLHASVEVLTGRCLQKVCLTGEHRKEVVNAPLNDNDPFMTPMTVWVVVLVAVAAASRSSDGDNDLFYPLEGK